MTDKKTTLIKIGHSPDPDDAFMFYAIARSKINLRGYKFEHNLRDIQTLNEWAKESRLEITAMSVFAYGQVTDRYLLLPQGISMGDKYGPLVVAKKEMKFEDLRGKKIAVPGPETTAFLTLRLFLPDIIAVQKPFDQIIDAVVSGEVEAGLIIHEGQLTYRKYNLHKVVDLGEHWFEQTGMPLPLGINAVRKDLEPQVQQDIKEIMKESIQFGMDHRDDALEYALPYGRGMAKELADKFVGMYVNHYTQELGDRGRTALQALLDKAHEKGFLKNKVKVEII